MRQASALLRGGQVSQESDQEEVRIKEVQSGYLISTYCALPYFTCPTLFHLI